MQKVKQLPVWLKPAESVWRHATVAEYATVQFFV